ncbi:hypothetical protein GCM10017673_58410 [Streptosporangium violaceochromogenes]|nr:hypothetical protein GCM10017673_58410 [Streptosporangium violaceochromogenes]
MADDEEDSTPQRNRCGACFGEGCNWEELNGQRDKHRKWLKCRACGGSGWQGS